MTDSPNSETRQHTSARELQTSIGGYHVAAAIRILHEAIDRAHELAFQREYLVRQFVLNCWDVWDRYPLTRGRKRKRKTLRVK
jgi:hypothetical protein